MKHFFNVLMWVVLMSIPILILLIADGLQALVAKGYWPYRSWVERTFPTKLSTACQHKSHQFKGHRRPDVDGHLCVQCGHTRDSECHT